MDEHQQSFVKSQPICAIGMTIWENINSVSALVAVPRMVPSRSHIQIQSFFRAVGGKQLLERPEGHRHFTINNAYFAVHFTQGTKLVHVSIFADGLSVRHRSKAEHQNYYPNLVVMRYFLEFVCKLL